MAKRGVSLNPGYHSGDHWAICDSCGFQFRAKELKETWDSRWVCDDDYEPRHPQDFLRVKKEKISVDQPIRPEQLNKELVVEIDATTGMGSSQAASGEFLYTYGNRAIVDQGRAGAAVAGLVYQDLHESNARTSIAGYAHAGYALPGITNLEENLSEKIPLSTFNLETL